MVREMGDKGEREGTRERGRDIFLGRTKDCLWREETRVMHGKMADYTGEGGTLY